MRVIVYGRPLQNQALASFVEGCKALGHAAVQRSAAVFTADQTEEADMVCVYGWRGTSPLIAKSYEAKGVPCVVLDSAYMHRDKGYYSVGVGGLNMMPDFDCPTDRLAAWGEFKPAKKGDKVLVIGQVTGDAQLPPDFNAYLWARETVLAAKDEFPHSRIVWKPHPKCEWMVCHDADETVRGALADALDGCFHIITYNSTAAYEAMLRGVKVICDSSAVYAAHVDNPLPFLQRVAYAQWTTDEIASGDALNFILQGPPAHVAGNAEAPRSNDAGRKTRNARKKGVA